ncbi:hypothetical protein [Streptomyces sp. NPDC018045]|uniref:hypothetical protein n=1 Tax=Streptomyces sp. NPDC018045 TaxID=3365037 RepID=UPI00379320A2
MPTPRSLTGRRRSRPLYPLLACGLIGGLAAPAAWAASPGTQTGPAGASVSEQRLPGPSAPRGRVGLWTSVNDSTPNRVYWGRTGDVARVGKRALRTDPALNGVWRSFLTMGTGDLHRRGTIREARLLIQNTWSQSCAPYNIEMWDTGRIYKSTTWKSQPRWYNWLDTRHPGPSDVCPSRTLSFNVTASARAAQRNKWPSMTLGLKASNESHPNAYKNFAPSTATLRVTWS